MTRMTREEVMAAASSDEMQRLAETDRKEFALRMTELCMGPEPDWGSNEPTHIRPFIDRTGIGSMSWTAVATTIVFVLVLASFVIPAVWGES